MNRLKGWLKQLRVLAAKDRVERELDEEVAFHLEMEAARLEREGMSPREASRAARLAFGGVERAKEEVRDGRWVRGVDNLLADLRYGVRTLRSRPGFAAAAIVTLALGIGGTTAVFSVVRSVLLEPLPYERPGQLVRLYQFDVEEPEADLFVSGPHFLEYRERASSFEELAALYTYHEVGADLTLGDRTERIVVLPVSADYFRLLGSEPALGREFTREEETDAPLAVVSAGLWRRTGLDRQGLGATIALDGPVLAAAAGLALGTAMLAGLLPAWRLARTAPLESLGESSRSATGGRRLVRLRQVLVAGQVALALTLLVGASALGASVYRLSRVDLGFRPEGVLTFQLNLPPGRYEAESRPAFHARVSERLAALPGVSRVGATTVLPATGTAYNWGTRALTGPTVGAEDGFVGADQRIVAGSYFETLGIPITQGRAFDERDGPEATPVAVVSESLARRLFPGISPLGQDVRMGGVERRIVGVAGDVALDAQGSPGPIVYHAHAQFANRAATLEYLVASDGDLAPLVPAIRTAVAQLDPQLVVYRPTPLDDVVRQGRSHRRFALALTAAFALLALVLAGVGIYGVLAYVVRQRTREIGVRVAMGAGPGRVVGMVLRDGLGVTLAGLALGTAGALALGRLLGSLVFETEPTEPLVLASAAAILLAAAATATLVPALRALRVSPRQALLEP